MSKNDKNNPGNINLDEIVFKTSSRRLEDVTKAISLRSMFDDYFSSLREITILHYEKNRQPFCDPLDLGYILHHCNTENFLIYLHDVNECEYSRRDRI